MRTIKTMLLSCLLCFALGSISGCGSPNSDDTTLEDLEISQSTLYRRPKYPLSNNSQITIRYVVDGDTLHIKNSEGKYCKARLLGVNTPECKKTKGYQAHCQHDQEYYGLQAYRTLKSLTDRYRGQKFRVQCREKRGKCRYDSFGRYLLYIETPQGKDLNQLMIRSGAGWSFTKYSSTRRAEYCEAEAAAIREKKGMWSRGRQYVGQRMSSTTKRWYFGGTNKNHDIKCTTALRESFDELIKP